MTRPARKSSTFAQKQTSGGDPAVDFEVVGAHAAGISEHVDAGVPRLGEGRGEGGVEIGRGGETLNPVQLDHETHAGPIPGADLLIVKDVLQHWPLAEIQRFIDTHFDRFSYVLVTNDVAHDLRPVPVNSDIAVGDWRPTDLTAPPFGLTAAWTFDYRIEDVWTKRMALFTGAPWMQR